jgi:hypothetical protein
MEPWEAADRSFRNKCLVERQGDLDCAVCVVTLSHIHETRKSADHSEIKVVKTVLTASERQNNAVGRLRGKFSSTERPEEGYELQPQGDTLRTRAGEEFMIKQ